MKKILALVLALMLVLGMTAALADYTVTITQNSTDEATHEYEAYQIFAGDLSADETTLSNITWGSGIDQTKLSDLATAINALRDSTAANYEALTASSTAAKFADAIAELNASTDDATAQAVAAAIGAALSTTTSGTGSATGVSGLDAGYYLVKDVDGSLDNQENGAYSRFMLQVIKSVTVAQKASVPSVVKKVKDVNDTTGVETDYQDSADYDIGDAVPFQITGTTSSMAHDYTKYHVTFVDDQSEGLDAPESFSIAVLGETLALSNVANASTNATVGKIKVTAEIVTAGSDFSIKVTFENTDNAGKTEDFVKLGNAVDSQAIVITYTSTLNSSAQIGPSGNPNEVLIKYSSNPNSSDDREEGETPKDKVIVFTYRPEITKLDGKNQALANAGFTLYKKVNDSTTTGAQKGSDIKAALTTQNPSINSAALEDDSYYVVKAMTLVTGETNIFEFKGIDDGTYVLVETTIPDGFNAYVSETIVVSAEHDASSDNPQLTELTADKVLTGDKTTGDLTGDIINQSGATLPSTGGIGTTIFYVGGGLLVLAAVILLVTKRRMSGND